MKGKKNAVFVVTKVARNIVSCYRQIARGIKKKKPKRDKNIENKYRDVVPVVVVVGIKYREKD